MRMQPDAVPATEIGAILNADGGENGVPDRSGGAADAPHVGRAQAAYSCESQRLIQPRDGCNPTANACESGMRAPSQGTHPLPGQAIAGNALGRHHRERIRPPSWWEPDRRHRPRTPSRGTHPTAIAPSSAEAERPRTLSRGTPTHAITSGRASRASGGVPPNQRMQSDAASRPEIVAILTVGITGNAVPIYPAARLMRSALGGHEQPMR